MTTSTAETVKFTVLRERREKLAGEYALVFGKHLELELSGACRRDAAGMLLDIEVGHGTDAMIGDRIEHEGTVYDVSAAALYGDRKQLALKKNDFETAFLALQTRGLAGYGRVEPVMQDDETERFMDSWVGTYITNIVAHYDEIKSGRQIREFHGLWNHDVAVACVGAGPSLDKNAEELRDFPGLIIVADKAYKMLRARGIEPDFVISVDCHYDLVAAMLDCPGTERHRLILNSCADPKIAKAWKGPIFYYNMKHPGVQFTDKILPALFPEMHSLPNAGNVGNTSIHFAEYCGLSPVVLVGQDFGYTGGKMHAQRFEWNDVFPGRWLAIEEDHAALMEKRSGKVEVNDVVTYAAFIQYMNTTYALRSHYKIDVVNCTEGGILRDLPCSTLREMKDMILRKHGGDSLRDARTQLSRI